MQNTKYIASCSGGKDSIATVLLTAQHNEPLDEIVYCEVMFNKEISGEIPEHRDFIYSKLKPFCENELGCRFTILRAEKTYDDVFHHVICRGPQKGKRRGFVWAGMCSVNRDCKTAPIRQYNSSFSGSTVNYIGIAIDEPKRLARLDGKNKVSLLAKYGYTEKRALELCKKYDLLSPIYAFSRRNGCWFCPNAGKGELEHLAHHHPELLDLLIAWEREDNIFHRKMTRTETPSEIRAKLSK